MSPSFVRLAAVAAIAYGAAAAIAQHVEPPSLPPGSDRVRPEAGLQEAERKRYVRAHHHKIRHKSDAEVRGTAAPVPASPAARK